MLSYESLREILKLAILAPSGDNSQPWEFEINHHTISIFNLPNRDATLYNFHQQGSYIAHGALVENIAIVASHFGYKVKIELFPRIENCTAHVRLMEGNIAEDPLYSAIRKRVTNRKPYKIITLEEKDKKALERSTEDFSDSYLVIIDHRDKIKEVALAVSANERLLMENRSLHDFLFGMIRWSRDAESKKPGLFIDTMELPQPVRFMFRHILGHWILVWLLNLFGFSRLLPKQTMGLYNSCSVICAIVINKTDNSTFINAGRAMQRFWLVATAQGLVLQPIAGIPYLARRVELGEGQAFSSDQINLIKWAYGKIVNALGLNPQSEQIAMLFRVGYDDTPSSYSVKLDPIIRNCT